MPRIAESGSIINEPKWRLARSSARARRPHGDDPDQDSGSWWLGFYVPRWMEWQSPFRTAVDLIKTPSLQLPIDEQDMVVFREFQAKIDEYRKEHG